MSSKSKLLFNSKVWEFAIKILVSILLIWVFYNQLFGSENSTEIWTTFLNRINSANPVFLIVAIALLPLNWFLEIKKWTILNHKIERLTFLKSAKAILAGITFGIVTPHRVGEIGGRVLFLQPENRIKGIVAIGVGSFAQFIVTVLIGTISLILVSFHKTLLPYTTTIFVFFLFSVVLVLMLAVFSRLDLFVNLLKSIKWLSKYPQFFRAINYLVELSQVERFSVLGISLLRYGIYLTQYVLLIKYLGVAVPLYLTFASASLIFLIQTGIPLPPILGLFARGEIAILVWSLWDVNEAVILCATFLLWMINLGAPAIIGVFIILKENLIKTNKYEVVKS